MRKLYTDFLGVKHTYALILPEKFLKAKYGNSRAGCSFSKTLSSWNAMKGVRTMISIPVNDSIGTFWFDGSFPKKNDDGEQLKTADGIPLWELYCQFKSVDAYARERVKVTLPAKVNPNEVIKELQEIEFSGLVFRAGESVFKDKETGKKTPPKKWYNFEADKVGLVKG